MSFSRRDFDEMALALHDKEISMEKSIYEEIRVFVICFDV